MKSLCGYSVAVMLSISVYSGAAAASGKFVVGYAAMNARMTPLWIGEEQGYFVKYGMETQAVFLRSATLLVTGMASGDIHVGSGGGSAALAAASSGQDVKIIGSFSVRNSYDFVSRSNIRRPEDLRGKKVGVTSIGGGNWAFTMLALEHWGLDVKRDKITIRVIGSDSVRAQAITTGAIDATQLSAYSYAAALKRQGSNILADMRDWGVPYQGTTVLARRSFVSQSPDVAEKVLTALVDSIAFIQDPANKPAVLKSLAKALRLAKVEEAADGYDIVRTVYERRIFPTPDGIRNIIRLLGASNEKIRALKAEDLIDDRTVKRMEQKGLFQSAAK